MKILDIVHRFHDLRTRVSKGLCRVRVFLGQNGKTVLLTDLGSKNDGQSVTNAVETIIASLIEQGLVIEPSVFIEHNEHEDAESDTFEKIVLEPTTSWVKLSQAEVLELIGPHSMDLNDRSKKNQKISNQADVLRYKRDPFVNSPYPESNETIKRRLEIEEGMIGKTDIENLVKAGSTEQEIQRKLKQDLSIFGEVYAKPDDEYICFSEYPLADGSIDFVVFTGRSRMDVILIEIKGADFNLMNSDHYGEFNHKIHQAAGQIRNRLGVIYRGLSAFQKSTHQIRMIAESGKSIHNSFLGPYSNIEVDPNKDINIRTIVIGGRTTDDLEESRKRHDYETSFTPPIRIESWDTWLRRLQRA